MIRFAVTVLTRKEAQLMTVNLPQDTASKWQNKERKYMSVFASQRPPATYLWSDKLGLLAFVSTGKACHGKPRSVSLGGTCYEIELGDCITSMALFWVECYQEAGQFYNWGS